jgi:hypothetical protein
MIWGMHDRQWMGQMLVDERMLKEPKEETAIVSTEHPLFRQLLLD